MSRLSDRNGDKQMRARRRPHRLNTPRHRGTNTREIARAAARLRAMRRARAAAASFDFQRAKAHPKHHAPNGDAHDASEAEAHDAAGKGGIWIDYGGDCLTDGEDPDYWRWQAKLRRKERRAERFEALRRRMRGAIGFLRRIVSSALKRRQKK
jgi:hypothetical protein